MASSLFLYWIESAICLLFAWGLYLAFRRRLSLFFRKWYLLPAPAFALAIPLLDFQWPHSETSLSQLPAKWARWVEWFPGGAIQISGMELLSLGYFLVTAVLLFRLSDRLAAAGRKPTETLELMFVEGGIALFWFQPILLLFRNELRRVESGIHNADALPARAISTNAPYLIFASVGSCLLLSWLFSANQVCRAPMWNDLESRTNEWKSQLETPLFQLGTPRQEQAWWSWGGYKTILTPLAPDTLTRFPMRMLSPFEFFSIYNQTWTWKRDGWLFEPISVEALALFPYQSKPTELGSLTEIQAFFNEQRYATEMTIFLKIEDKQNRPWLAVVGVSEKERVYGYWDVLQTWGLEMPIFEWKKSATGRNLAVLTPHSPYALVWGGIRLPLDFRANPNVYGAYAIYDLEEFKKLAEGPVQFYMGDSLLLAESVRVTLMDDYSRPNYYISGMRQVELDSGSAHVSIAPEDYRPASTWTIVATLPGNIEVNAVNLEIRDSDTAYDPPLRAQGLPRIDTMYSFQLVTRDEPPSLLRIDTSLARNRKILDMYRGNDAYRIVHIPGFQTYDRLVQTPESTMALLREEELPLDSVFLGDLLPELPYHLLDTLYLEWGSLFAAPDSKVYSLEEFRSQQGEPIRINGGGQSLKIHSFAMYLYQENRPLRAGWFSPQNVPFSPGDSLSNWVRPRTSLFIDQLVVADGEGDLFSAPLVFAFHIGKSEADIRWKVTVEQVEAGEESEPERVEEDQSLAYRNYPLTDLIAELSRQPKSRMDFRGLGPEPIVNVRLSANGPLPERAREFMLNELQKQFRFDFSHERLPRPNWRLHLKDPDLLNLANFKGKAAPEEKIRVFKWEGTHVLTGVTLDELALHLEHRFDEIVEWFPNAFMADRFSFSMDCSSLNSVQFQMESEYGIVFQRMDMLWEGVVVRFRK
ncbi:MAG: hypothetical protein IPJ00_10675 [Saprospirales bacterium]|nr:hypothetical protein [Saprospirales bacterium]